MKKSIILRVLTALAGVLLAVLGVCMLGEAFFGLPLTQRVGQLLGLRGFAAVLPAAASLAAIALGIGCIGGLIPCRKGNKRNFVMQKGENGTIGISLRSIEGLVQTCVQKHVMIEHADVKITETRQGLIIRLDVDQASGVNIPLAIGLLQKQIRQYVSACTGVDVLEVRVMVENNGAIAPESPYMVSDGMGDALLSSAATASVMELTETPDALKEPVHIELPVQEYTAPAEETEPEEEVSLVPDLDTLDETVLAEIEAVEAPEEEEEEERPLHQRLFGAEEQPVIVPAPPELVVEPAADEAEVLQPEEYAQPEEENQTDACIEEADAEISNDAVETDVQEEAVSQNVEEVAEVMEAAESDIAGEEAETYEFAEAEAEAEKEPAGETESDEEEADTAELEAADEEAKDAEESAELAEE